MSTGPVVIVTGAFGNLGRVLTGVLTARGLRVAAIERGGVPLVDGAALHIAADDLTDPAQAEAAVAQAATLGPIAGVATTVGGFAWAGLADSPPALWEQMFRLNVLTALTMLRASVPLFHAAGGGSFVAVGAGAALRAPSGMSAYAASKAGVLRLVESAADELKAARIRVNAVLPGTMDTPQNRASMPDADPSLWTTPLEVAETIAFLLSGAASGITGAAIPVPGRS